MSDLPQGPGWWRASDGLYYPPEARPGYSPDPDPDGEPESGGSTLGESDQPFEDSPDPTGWGADQPTGDEPTLFDAPPVDPDEPDPTATDPTRTAGVIDDDLYERDWAVDDEAEPEGRRLLPILALVAVAGLLAGVAVWFFLDGNDDSETASTTSTTAATDPETSAPSTTEDNTDTTADGEVSAFDVGVGDCFDPVEVEEAEGLMIRAVRLIDCAEPHRAEVVAVETLDTPAGEPFPGAEARDTAAEELCTAPIEEFLGGPLAESSLLVLWLAPSEESWPEDDREVVCMVASPDGETLTGSVAGSGAADSDTEGEP